MPCRKKQNLLTKTPTEYPFGTYVETEAGYFFIKDASKRYRITTGRCLDSWRPHRVVKTTEAAVKRYRIAAKMKFRNGSLIWNISDGKVYLIEDGLRRWVRNPDVFWKLGLDPTKTMKEVVWVSMDEINLHREGDDLI